MKMSEKLIEAGAWLLMLSGAAMFIGSTIITVFMVVSTGNTIHIALLLPAFVGLFVMVLGLATSSGLKW